jgi:tetratricopeptide (TPR) repeat protein
MKLFLTVLMALAATATAARGGLYNTSEPEEERKSDLSLDSGDWFPLVFRETLIRLRSIGITSAPRDNALRKRYVQQADFAARLDPARLSTEEKLNLGAVFMRRKKVDSAKGLLEPLARQEPRNFLVQSNLAMAYYLGGVESRAITQQDQTLAVWPQQFSQVETPFQEYLRSLGWHEGAFDFYRKAETYQLKLLKLRERETLEKRGAKTHAQTVDALFDDGKNPPQPVKFVGPSGKYEAGKVAPAEKAKLPKDAIDIVQQLLIWMPEDVRLYWLLGELYNAQGGTKNIHSARMIFDELAGWNGLGFRSAELAEHRQVLNDYKGAEQNEPTISDLEKKVDDV